MLLKGHVYEGNGTRLFPADECYMITLAGKGGADANHSLVVAEIIGDRKNEFLRPFHSTPNRGNINGNYRKNYYFVI